MIRINLLPHRQIKRAERQRRFNLMAGLVFIAGIAIVFMVYTVISAQVDHQLERNSRLEQANIKLDKEIADIKSLREKIQDLLSRKQVVENLQTNRSQAVAILDEITRKIPEGTYLKSIKQDGFKIEVNGIADTNARIATFVRNLSDSQWLASPNLVEIKSTVINNIKYNDFIINVSVKQPEVASSKKEGAENASTVATQ